MSTEPFIRGCSFTELQIKATFKEIVPVNQHFEEGSKTFKYLKPSKKWLLLNSYPQYQLLTDVSTMALVKKQKLWDDMDR